MGSCLVSYSLYTFYTLYKDTMRVSCIEEIIHRQYIQIYSGLKESVFFFHVTQWIFAKQVTNIVSSQNRFISRTKWNDKVAISMDTCRNCTMLCIEKQEGNVGVAHDKDSVNAIAKWRGINCVPLVWYSLYFVSY